MTTVESLINTTRERYINSGHREERNRLSTALSDTDETVSVAFDLGGITRGARLSVGLEDMYVWGAAGLVADVDRGQYGTVAANHPDRSIVLINARPTPADTLAALNETVTTLTNQGLFRVAHVDITVDRSTVAYELPSTDDWIAPLDARLRVDSQHVDDWPLVPRWEVVDEAPLDGGGTGRVVRLFDFGRTGDTVRVRYRAALTAGLTGLDDDVEQVTGIEPWAVDLLPLGAALTLVAGREIARSRDDYQGGTRRAEEVPPNAQLVASRGVQATFDARVTAVKRRLHQQYTVRMRAAR